jgi:hypothetical protein
MVKYRQVIHKNSMRNKITILIVLIVLASSAPFVYAATVKANPNTFKAVYASMGALVQRITNLESSVNTLQQQITIPIATPPTSSPSTVMPTSPPPSVPDSNSAPTKKRYKILTNVDPCTLTKYSNDNWTINNIGNVNDIIVNTDDNCRSVGTQNAKGFDWIIMEKDIAQ